MKAHLVGGTLRTVMVAEVIRCFKAHQGRVDPTALELGVTPRTLRLWKHTWPELYNLSGMMERLLKETEPKKGRKLKEKKKRFKKLKMKSERTFA